MKILNALITSLLLLIFSSCNKQSIVEGVSYGSDAASLQISSISPQSGGYNTTDTIFGANFGNDSANVEVYYSGQEATINQFSDSEIIVTVPSGLSTGPVTVDVGSQDATGPVFTALVGEYSLVYANTNNSTATNVGNCMAYPSTVPGNIDVSIELSTTIRSGSIIRNVVESSFTIVDMPQGSSGTYSLGSGTSYVNSSKDGNGLYGLYYNGNTTYGTLGNQISSVVKTGSNTFTFSSTVSIGGQDVTINGMGTY
jgi:hypothetical protein